MQLGTRWTAGEEPPNRIPDAMRAEIRTVEGALPPDALGQPKPRWTLTWLEGRPVAELETGAIVSLDAEGRPVVRHDGEDEFG
jgi:hypothetical protein